MTELERFLTVLNFERPDYWPLLAAHALGTPRITLCEAREPNAVTVQRSRERASGAQIVRFHGDHGDAQIERPRQRRPSFAGLCPRRRAVAGIEVDLLARYALPVVLEVVALVRPAGHVGIEALGGRSGVVAEQVVRAGQACAEIRSRIQVAALLRILQ